MVAKLKVGTRQSRLALWQTEWIVERLRAADPSLRIEIVPIRTTGDRAVNLPLGQIGDKGLFVKELELALLDGSIDLAVHSLKDLPSSLAPGLRIAAVGPREDPRDALISRTGQRLADLPAGATIGTSSARRQAQILAVRPDLTVIPLRGNVGTRLDKIAAGECTAGVLAAAGLVRLDRTDAITEYLDPAICLPAPGQGIIAGEVAEARDDLIERLAAIDDRAAHLASQAERACTVRLTGGCQIPVAAYAEMAGDEIWLRALVADPEGTRIIRAEARGAAGDAEAIGRRVAEELIAAGAGDLLIRSSAGR